MDPERTGAIILAGPEGSTPPERLVTRAARAAALGLIDALHASGVGRIVVAAQDCAWLPSDSPALADVDTAAFHFGARVTELIERHGLECVMVFGAGSAPLLTAAHIGAFLDRLRSADRPLVLTNNLHSSDWVAWNRAAHSLDLVRAAARDNSLAWMLYDSGRYTVEVPPALTPVEKLDLDTPGDLALLARHPRLPPRLAHALTDPLLARVPVDAVVEVAARDGSRVALIGRVAPGAWHALSRATRCWVRTYSEERGMVASERLARGEVRSLLRPLYERLGPAGFFEALGDVADAAIMDSRVLMAASGHHPGAADRYASDLFLADAIQDEWVRTFTAAACAAPIPVLLGGHSVVSGGLEVLAGLVAARRGGASG